MQNKKITCKWCGNPIVRHKPFTLDCFYPMSFYHIKCFKNSLIQNKVLTSIASNDTLG